MFLELTNGGATSGTETDDYNYLNDKVMKMHDPSAKTLLLPFSAFPKCVSYQAGTVVFKYLGDGSVRDLIRIFESDFREKIEGEREIHTLVDKLKRGGVHTTILKMEDDDVTTATSYACFNCTEKRLFVKKKKSNKDDGARNFFLLFRKHGFDYRYHVCRVKKCSVVCPSCKIVFTSSGHSCYNVCKPINVRSLDSIFKQTLCMDIFYDIETYSERGSDKFFPGLVAFTVVVRRTNASNWNRDEVEGRDEAYMALVRSNVESVMSHYGVDYKWVQNGLKKQKCYYFRDDQLDEENDIMLTFTNFVERLTLLMYSFDELNADRRVSLISFNGNKFDDFFFFKALTKKGSFCGQGLNKCSILERGSKLLCLSFNLQKNSSSRPLYFRTHDLRNFLITGSLQSNAQKFDVPCGKTVFPHPLIDAIKAGKESRVLKNFPDYAYYENVIKSGRCEHDARDCGECKKKEYSLLRAQHEQEFGIGFDAFEVWTVYCCNDVLVTQTLYYHFNECIVQQFKPLFKKEFDPSSKLTLPSLTNALAYKYASSHFKGAFFTPISDYLKHTMSSVYGGHCQTNIIGEVPSPEKKVFFDFNSEYSGLMTAPVPCGRVFQISKQRCVEIQKYVQDNWTGVCKTHYLDHKFFIVTCVLHAPSDTRKHVDYPCIPERTAKGNLLWTNRTKRGVYGSVDVYLATSKYGYSFEIVDDYRNIEFEQWQPLLRDYVLFCQDLKITGKRENNPAKENVGKLMGNALYGYQIKKPDVEKVVYVSKIEDYCGIKMNEHLGLLKIQSVCPVKEIINPRTSPKHMLKMNDVPPWDDDGNNLALYSDDVLEMGSPSEPVRQDFPALVKMSEEMTAGLDSNTMKHVGSFILQCSRDCSTEFQLDMILKPEDFEIPLEERGIKIYYSDTDSFLVDDELVRNCKWYGSQSVRFNDDTRKFEPWGKNELSFVPKSIYIAGKKLYLCKGESDNPYDMKTASKGVDKAKITEESFKKLIRNERVQFEQVSFKKNFDTYDIECTAIRRQLGLGSLSMVPFYRCEKYVLYRPLNDSDDPALEEEEENSERSLFYLSLIHISEPTRH